MKIWFAPNSRAVRIVWLLEELGLGYELERFELGSKAMRAPAFLAVSPMGRVPVLEDESGRRLFESGAIVEYVLARHGKGRLVPATASASFAPYLQWLHYAEGIMMGPIGSIVVETVLLPPERRSVAHAERAMKLLNRSLEPLEQTLQHCEYLADTFSGADIMTGHASIVAAGLGADLTDKPALASYIARLKARPALQVAMAA